MPIKSSERRPFLLLTFWNALTYILFDAQIRLRPKNELSYPHSSFNFGEATQFEAYTPPLY